MQEILLLSLSLLFLAVVNWEFCMLVCILLLGIVAVLVLILLLVVVIVQLYCVFIAYARKGAAKIHTWLFS